MSEPIVAVTLPAVPASAALARHAVMSALADLDLDPVLQGDIALVVSEAVTNAVNHAYVGREPGDVRVGIRRVGDQLELDVEDDGSGMVPRPDTPGLGLGMPLIATLSERFEIQAPATGGTRLCVWFDRTTAVAVE